MKSNKMLSLIGYGIFFLTSLVILLFGKFYMPRGSEFGYVLLNFYIIMPIVAFAIGLILGIKNAFLKWLYPIFAWLLCSAILIMIFSLRSWNWICLLFSLVPAMLGVLLGFLIWKVRRK